jgi:hypothetical protein
LTDSELDFIREKADAVGLSLSAFMRSAAMSRPIKKHSATVASELSNVNRLGGLLRLGLTMVDQGKLTSDLRSEILVTLNDLRRMAKLIEEEVA